MTPVQKGISKVETTDLTQLGLIKTAEDQKTRDNGKWITLHIFWR